jgi:hypothetical protein
MEEPTLSGWSALYMIKLCFKSLNYVYAGGFHDAMARAGTPELDASGWVEEMREQKRKFGKQGGIVDDGGDAGMGGVGVAGGGGYNAFENFILYDPGDAESVAAAEACNIDAGQVAGGYNYFFKEKEEIQSQLAAWERPVIFKFQQKIKETFDPNGVGDGSYLYIEESASSRGK